MTWKTADTNTGTELSRSFLNRLNEYIEKKESQIAIDCLRALESLTNERVGTSDPADASAIVRLSQGVGEFSAKVHQLTLSHSKVLTPGCWKTIAAKLNGILWDEVDFLEGAISELFFEVSRIDLQMWSNEIMDVVKEMKGVLAKALDEVEVAVNGLNRALVELRTESDAWRWSIKRIFENTVLDEELIPSIRSSRIALLNGYEKFTKVYENLNSMKEEIVASVVRIGTKPIFSTMEPETQQNFLDLYELLKCSEKNRKRNLIEEKDLLMSLRKSMSKEQAFAVFRDYYHALYTELFRQSLEIKKNAGEMATEQGRAKELELLKEVQSEVLLLGSTIDHYREFLLSTDPNPYVRARLGFTEWVLGPESKETKHLYKFGYNIESLNRLYTQLIESVEKGPQAALSENSENQGQVERVLHEMGAPLLSEKIMKDRAERLITLLENINELGSFDFSIVTRMGNWLAKAIRSDWRHHLLQRYPEFHEIYAIHMGLAGGIDDKLHLSRTNKFKRVLGELKEWIAQRETAHHTHDIDLDINDIRGYLQEFLAHVQRVLKEEGNDNQVESFSQQLLEYRYLFGYFFYQLNDENTEEHLIRAKCHFVDQYFEAVDKLLSEFAPSRLA